MVTIYSSEDLNAAYDIVAGLDGALWFTEGAGEAIGRISTTGVVSTYTNPELYTPLDITTGPDGALWFTNLSGNSIGRITVVPSISSSRTSGQPGRLVAMSGEGYSPGELVNVKYSTRLSIPYPRFVDICSAIANPDGTFGCLGHIPSPRIAGPPGGHAIRAIGKRSGATARMTFTLS